MPITPLTPTFGEEPDYLHARAAILAWAGVYPASELNNYVINFMVTVKSVSDFNFQNGIAAKRIAIQLIGGPNDRHCNLFVQATWMLIPQVNACSCG